MTEWLALLLPVAAGYGWIMGRNNAKNQALQENQKLTNQYSKGLKFLLDREEDQGLEHLIQLLEVSANSVEHYLTLAVLFRRRGELDRAIKIHELLLTQALLEKDVQHKVKLELAEDYILAGLLDLAETQLLELLKHHQSKPALNLLFKLFLQTSDWQKGVEYFEKSQYLFTNDSLKLAVANFYCEIALKQNDSEVLQEGINVCPYSIRLRFEAGLAAYKKSDYVLAIAHWRDLLLSDPDYCLLFIENLEQCYVKLNIEDQFLELLQKTHETGGVLLKIKYCEQLVKRQQTEQAVSLLESSLIKEPNIRCFNYFISLLAKQNQSAEKILSQIQQLVEAYIATKNEYQCTHCGFTSHKLYWSCPSCKNWETIKPCKGIDGF